MEVFGLLYWTSFSDDIWHENSSLIVKKVSTLRLLHRKSIFRFLKKIFIKQSCARSMLEQCTSPLVINKLILFLYLSTLFLIIPTLWLFFNRANIFSQSFRNIAIEVTFFDSVTTNFRKSILVYFLDTMLALTNLELSRNLFRV